jgi:hypothetical protein
MYAPPLGYEHRAIATAFCSDRLRSLQLEVTISLDIVSGNYHVLRRMLGRLSSAFVGFRRVSPGFAGFRRVSVNTCPVLTCVIPCALSTWVFVGGCGRRQISKCFWKSFVNESQLYIESLTKHFIGTCLFVFYTIMKKSYWVHRKKPG